MLAKLPVCTIQRQVNVVVRRAVWHVPHTLFSSGMSSELTNVDWWTCTLPLGSKTGTFAPITTARFREPVLEVPPKPGAIAPRCSWARLLNRTRSELEYSFARE